MEELFMMEDKEKDKDLKKTSKRRDNKKRILRNGESQDKSGRYRYTYYEGKRQKCLYSWRLEPTDPVPPGKRYCEALRDLERDVAMFKAKGVSYNGGGLTVLDLTERYIRTRKDVKHTTRAGYKTVINILKRDSFGSRMIRDVTTMEAKAWLIRLQESGKSYSAIHSIRGVVRPAFQSAVEDDLIAKNPFQFELAKILVNDSITRTAISPKQERQFLEFVKSDIHFKRYYDGIFLLFKTGLRISEFCGLTTSDIDMDNRTINVDHQLQRTSEMEYVIEPPKTEAGKRVLPMTDEVYDCLKSILSKRPHPKKEPIIDGYTGFLFLDKRGMPKVAMHWEKYFQHICEKYNSIYKIQMPKVTPHVCRHTYCSNKARSGMNAKTLQYLMGHSEISVTLDTYTHLGFDDAKAELIRLGDVDNDDENKKKA